MGSFPGSTLSLAGLRLAIGELREEHNALRDCLASAGVLRTEAFLAQVHRRRFERLRRTCPCGAPCSSLPEVLGANELIGLTSMRLAGLPSARALSASSRSTAQTMRVVAAPLLRACTRLYIVGGADGQKALSTAERFDPASGRWEPLPPLSQPRAAAAAAVVGGRLHVCGGVSGQRELGSVERFEHMVGIWENLPPLSQPRCEANAGEVWGSLCVCGGLHNQNASNSAERFDASQGMWEALRPMREARSEAASAVLNGFLYVCGGNAAAGAELGPAVLNSVERLDPQSGAWTLVPPLSQERYGAAATIVGGRLCVYGGHSGREFLCSAERFDHEAQMWEDIRPLSMPRAGFAAAAVVGSVYICGGHDGQRALRTVERLVPSESAWQLMVPLRHSRASAVAAVVIW